MPQANRHGSLTKSRQEIADKVRDLRLQRGWTQVELAKQLHLSQNRLSEIEAGKGSFTAEQFLLLLRLFNVAATDFVRDHPARDLEVQNALARLGANHLQENTHVLPSKELEDVHDVVREALLLGAPRLVTAVAPVLSAHAERLNLSRLYAELEKLGHERRLAWVVDNTLTALNTLVHTADSDGAIWVRLRRRTEVPFKLFLDFVASRLAAAQSPEAPPDVLDATIRSRRTLEDVQRNASKPSLRWRIATSLQPEDFVQALRASRATG